MYAPNLMLALYIHTCMHACVCVCACALLSLLIFSLTVNILTVAFVSGCIPHIQYPYGHYRVLRKDFHDSEMRRGYLNQELK